MLHGHWRRAVAPDPNAVDGERPGEEGDGGGSDDQDAEGPPMTAPDRLMIEADKGGTLESEDGKVRFTIEADSIDEDTEFFNRGVHVADDGSATDTGHADAVDAGGGDVELVSTVGLVHFPSAFNSSPVLPPCLRRRSELAI